MSNDRFEIATALSVSPRHVVVDDAGSRRAPSGTVDLPVSDRLLEVDHAAPAFQAAPLPDAETVQIEKLVREEDQVFNWKTGRWE